MAHICVSWMLYITILSSHLGESVGLPPTIVKQSRSNELFFLERSTPLGKDEDKIEPLIIECEAVGDPPPEYRWHKNGVEFINSNSTQKKYIDQRVFLPRGSGTLFIISPREEDEGQYQCFASNKWGTAMGSPVFVRKSYVNESFTMLEETRKVKEGAMLKLECHPPEAYPKVEVVWRKVKDVFNPWVEKPYLDSPETRINSSSITQDPEGNLWFTSIALLDTILCFYMCFVNYKREEHPHLPQSIEDKPLKKVTLKLTRSKGEGLLDNVYREIFGNQKVVKPEIVYGSPKRIYASLGSAIDIWCIAYGKPVPKLEWSRLNETLRNERVEYGNYGKTMKLKNVELRDEGQYICEAKNELGHSAMHVVELNIFVKPYFKTEPKSRNVTMGENVTLNCDVDGRPDPQIQWTYNAELIEGPEINSRMQIRSNKIEIKNVLAEDTGNYGCNASNIFGYVYKGVYLNVLQNEKTIIINDTEKAEAFPRVTLNEEGALIPAPVAVQIVNETFEELTQNGFEPNSDIEIDTRHSMPIPTSSPSSQPATSQSIPLVLQEQTVGYQFLSNPTIFAFGLGTFSAFVLFSIGFIFYRKKYQIVSRQIQREFIYGRPPSKTNSENYSETQSEQHIFGVKYDAIRFEVKKESFKEDSSVLIGSGNFGIVYKTRMVRFGGPVAVKVPRSPLGHSETQQGFVSFLREIKVMSYVGEHQNILRMLGAYTKEIGRGYAFIVTELCENGSLLAHLRKWNRDEGEMTRADLYELYRFCQEISSGMAFLAEKKVVHGDLSTRNILLDSNYTCKISDFGLSRCLERYQIYVKKSPEPLPWPWMAIECLERFEFTLKSDVWSLGVVFWEICNFGQTPYAGLNWDVEFCKRLREGLRLPKPKRVVSEIMYEVMLSCWCVEPKLRPEPSQLIPIFQELRGEALYINFGYD